MNAEDLAALNEEIAGMARAGLPLDQGLAAIAQDLSRGTLKQVTAELAEDLKAGHTLPEALKRQGGRVPPFYAGLVTAGLRTGRISEVLATLTVYARSIANLRQIIIEATFYPAAVLLFAIIPFSILAFYVVPQFDEIFKDLRIRLPAITELVLGVSRYPFELFVVPFLVFGVGVLVLRFTLRMTERGRRTWARLVYAIPVIGVMIRSARLAAFTELLAILVDHEVPLPEAFQLAGEGSSDPVMASTAREVQHNLSQGMPLSEALRGKGLVAEWVSWMAGLGEKRGTLGKTLHHIAQTYRRQVEMRAQLLRSILPPFLIVLTVGGFAVLYVFALILPLMKLMDALSK